MDQRQQHVIAFYTRHPISAKHILGKLEARRGTLDGLRPEDLWDHDQDHYGGLAVNDVLLTLIHERSSSQSMRFIV